jgi:prevent-host-death family protein
MSRIVNIYDAKTNLSKLLADVASGEEIVIARAGEPIAKLTPITRSKREIGFAEGMITIADDFDETPEAIVEDFYR